MKTHVQYQYKDPNSARPDDAEDYAVHADDGELLILPDVGDTVTYIPTDTKLVVARKVLTKHFSYIYGGENLGTSLVINIVVTDVSAAELDARIKE